MTKGIRDDGIKTLADLKQRCRVDPETGCWHWQGAMKGGSARIWIPSIGVCAMNTALPFLATGEPAARGAIYVPTCDNVACGNWDHRRPGSRSELMTIVRPKMPEATRIKMAATKRERGRYSKAAHIDIMTSRDVLRVLAKRWNFSVSHVQRVKAGGIWADAQWRTVRATPPPRFEPQGPVPRVVSSSECRTWAKVASSAMASA